MTNFLTGLVRYAGYTSLMLLCTEALAGEHMSWSPRLVLGVCIAAIISGLLTLLEMRLRTTSLRPES